MEIRIINQLYKLMGEGIRIFRNEGMIESKIMDQVIECIFELDDIGKRSYEQNFELLYNLLHNDRVKY